MALWEGFHRRINSSKGVCLDQISLFSALGIHHGLFSKVSVLIVLWFLSLRLSPLTYSCIFLFQCLPTYCNLLFALTCFSSIPPPTLTFPDFLLLYYLLTLSGLLFHLHGCCSRAGGPAEGAEDRLPGDRGPHSTHPP